MSVHFPLDDMDIFTLYIIINDEWEPNLKAHYFSTDLIYSANTVGQRI